MTQSRGGCRRTFTFGCLGCFAALVLLTVVSAIVIGIAWNQARHEEIEKRELTKLLTVPADVTIEDVPLGTPTEFVVTEPAGRIILNLRNTVFEIRPAPSGDPLRVEARFDANHYALSESFDEGLAEDGWTYEVTFRRTSGFYALTALRELLGGTRPRVEVFLPSDVPFDLELDVTQGGADVELGGLWLINADLRFLQGGGAVQFSDPLRCPAETFAVQFTQGGGAIEGIAHASPRKLEVTFTMGGGSLDLRGPWQRDAEIFIDQSMGGVSVRLPRDVALRGLGRYDTERGRGPEDDTPVLRFSTSSHFGELEFLR